MNKSPRQHASTQKALIEASIGRFPVIFTLILISLALILPLRGYLGLAQESTEVSPEQAKAIDTKAYVNNFVDSSSPIPYTELDQEALLRQSKGSKFIDRIKKEISSSETSLSFVNNLIDDANSKIEVAQEKILSLTEQLASLDAQIQSSQKMIDNVNAQIKRKQSEIDTLEYQIEQKQIEISFQKQTVLEFLAIIYKEQNQFNSMNTNGAELNTLKLLLSDDSAGENLRSLRYSEVLENQGKEIFEKLSTMIDEQQINQKIMEVKKRTLQVLHNKLLQEMDGLDMQKKAKVSLMDQTKGDQKIYEEMLARSNAEQQDVLQEITTLHKNMLYVKERMKSLGSNFNADDYTNLLNAGTKQNLVEYLAGATDAAGDFQPVWPVNPAKGISAYYLESAYYKVFHMKHNAIDIRTPQGTPIHAPADGVIYRAQDNGFGYSYVMIAHAGGYMTLYGHVSDIMVMDGQSVKAGDVIGLSGATPGTKGAGLYTTGPHLHFEILKDGVHVDPLEYMNLAYLELDALPEKYVAKALGDKEKVRRIPVNPVQEKVRRHGPVVVDEPTI